MKHVKYSYINEVVATIVKQSKKQQQQKINNCEIEKLSGEKYAELWRGSSVGWVLSQNLRMLFILSSVEGQGNVWLHIKFNHI